MSFINPEYFWLLLFLLAGFIKKDLRDLHFASYGIMFTFIFIVIALCRPVIVQEPLWSKQALSDVIVAVDLSYSMQASDIIPSRLEKAKEILGLLVKTQTNTRFGVLGFTTNAIVLSPLTEDSELLLHLFNSLDTTLVMTKGSDIYSALKLGRKMSVAKKLSFVILTDGGDEKEYEEEAKFARDQGLIVHIFMLASDFGSTIKLENGELLKDASGDIVVSRENKNTQEIAQISGGSYTKDFASLQDALREQKNKDYLAQVMVVRNIELFYYFVFLALVTFLVSVTTLKRFVIAFLLLFGLHVNASVLDIVHEKRGKTAYEKENYEEAVKHYGKIQKDRAYFNTACGYYKSGEYEKALTYFLKVKSDDAGFKSAVFYNTANTFVRLKEFKKAREAYLKSLTLAYTLEADENLAYIKEVPEQMTMSTGQQKTKQKSATAKQESSSAKEKEGGSSNMKVSANAGAGGDEHAKKTQSESMLNLNTGKAKLSSKQYELINKRLVNEKKPW